jgi:hypothetical protein
MVARIKAKDTELLTPANISRVIRALSAEKPITKVAACQMLNIAYNSARLDKIITLHKERIEQDKARRTSKRGTELSKDEISIIITEYMSGSDILSISKLLARTTAKIKATIDKLGIPKRSRSQDYFKPELIPEESVRTSFSIGEKVWSARYESYATIKAEVPHPQEKVYRIYLEDEKYQEYAYQPASELASLSHLVPLGLK